MDKVDLTVSSSGTFADLMAALTRLGASDETAGRPDKTANQIVALLHQPARRP